MIYIVNAYIPSAYTQKYIIGVYNTHEEALQRQHKFFNCNCNKDSFNNISGYKNGFFYITYLDKYELGDQYINK